MSSILNIIDTSGPGGAETVFINLCVAQKSAGDRPIAVVKGEGYVLDQLKRNGIDTHVIESKGSFNFQLLTKLLRIIREEKVDLIQSHLFGSAVYAGLAGLLSRRPVFSTIHGVVDIRQDDRLLKAKLLILRLGCRKIIAVSDQIFSMLNNLPLLPQGRVATIYNGIDTSRYSKLEQPGLRARMNLQGQVVIGALGNIRRPKNYPLAVDALECLHKKGLEAHLLIAGDGKGDLLNELQQRIGKAGLERYVHVLGFVDNVQDFLSSLDVLMISSSSEGHPLALTQAMVNALPIVATPCGVEDILEDGHDALIAEAHDAGQLAERIDDIIRNPELGRKLAANARNKALERYSMESMTDSYYRLYQSVVG